MTRHRSPGGGTSQGRPTLLPGPCWRQCFCFQHLHCHGSWPGQRVFMLSSGAFANPEDAQRHGGLQYCRTDPDVERCLRAHRNDMETIYPFLFLGFVYSFLGPNPFIAWMHFLVFFLGRMVHTVAYLGKLRAPTRSLAYTLAQLPCASMALQIVWEAARHL
ncbi:prostaglandin E synthase isoform X1 [Oryx dammah]|uniref:prostaglandin E synthase isoform X1 n=1 Tax=Oryx dammah TaxID=59534 RepID=UPI001A9BDE7F|nr:prostaglandin E synthase isoform X1 [Oryx dammah]